MKIHNSRGYSSFDRYIEENDILRKKIIFFQINHNRAVEDNPRKVRIFCHSSNLFGGFTIHTNDI